MLLQHWSLVHMSAELQLGPPSVERMTTVRPFSLVSWGRSALSVLAVGVPPAGVTEVAAMKPPVVGPTVGDTGSPGETWNTSPPGMHPPPLGNSAAPTLMSEPSVSII